MTATFVQFGENLNYTNSGNDKISAGDLVVLGNGVGVAACEMAAGEKGTISTEGVYAIAKDAATDTYDQGAPVYYDSTNKKIKAAYAAGYLHIGFAAYASASGASDAMVKLIPGGLPTVGGLNAVSYASQTLTTAQKTQARENIGAAASD